MMDENVYVALEIGDHELKIVAGQFYNTRLNILKVERVSFKGVSGVHIQDQSAVIQTLQKAMEHVGETLGFEIKRVLLSLPSYGLSRYKHRVTLEVDEFVKLEDIKRGLKEASAAVLPAEKILVNVSPVRFMIGGIGMRKLPLGEKGDELSMDVDLVCADKAMVYRYLSTVEKAGYEIIEIGLENYAFGKEASLFEKSLEQHIIAVRYGRQMIGLSLFSKGRLISHETIGFGLGRLISKLSSHYRIKQEAAERLVMNTLRMDLSSHSAQPVHAWKNEQDMMFSVSENDIVEVLQQDIEQMVDTIRHTIHPILEAGNVKLVLYGDGAEMNGLDTYLSNQLGVECTAYIPETMGVRSSSLASALGMFYILKDQAKFYRFDASINMVEFNQMMVEEQHVVQPDDTLSSKFKGLFDRR